MLHIWRELSGAGCNTKGPISFIEPEDKAILCEICHSPETQPSTKPWSPAGRWWPKTGLHHTGDSTQLILLAPTRIFLCYMQFLFFVIAKSTINQPARKLNWSDWQLSSLQPRLRAKTKQSKISAPKSSKKENKQGKQNKENKQDNPPPPTGQVCSSYAPERRPQAVWAVSLQAQRCPAPSMDRSWKAENNQRIIFHRQDVP